MRSVQNNVGLPTGCRRWRVEARCDDGRRVLVETMAGSEDEAAARVRTLGWVGDVTGCEALGVLGEEVRVVPEKDSPGRTRMLTEVGGARRWTLSGEPEEDWWAEVGAHGERMPGEWEYDRAAGIVVCSLLCESAPHLPWTFTVELDGDGEARELLAEMASRCGCSKVSRDTWAAKPGDEVESQCLALSLISKEPRVMGHVLSMVAYEDDGEPLDCIEILLGGDSGSREGR